MFANKYLLLIAISWTAVTSAGIIPVDDHLDHQEEHHEPKYEYKYGVEDHHSGDMKSHSEKREGEVVKGEYTVVQPDGKTRIVSCATDEKSGFHAIVTYFDLNGHHEHH